MKVFLIYKSSKIKQEKIKLLNRGLFGLHKPPGLCLVLKGRRNEDR